MKKIIVFLFLLSSSVVTFAQSCYECNNIVVSGAKIISIGQTVTYTAVATGCNYQNPNTKLVWDFGDATTPVADNNGGVHTYTIPGVYTIKCYVATGSSCKESYGQMKVIVNGCAKCQDFTFYHTNQPCVKQKIKFVKSIGLCRVEATPVNYTPQWDYGDGTPITADSTHKYEHPGMYTVIMYMNDCVYAKTISVSNCAAFACDPPQDCIQFENDLGSAEIQFKANVSGNYEYEVILPVGLPPSGVTYNYQWSIVKPVPDGVTIVGDSTLQTFIISKPAGLTDDVVLDVQICTSNNQCCISKEYSTCGRYKPELTILSETHFVPPSNNQCVINLQVALPILGSMLGSTYSYAWFITDPNAAITPVVGSPHKAQALTPHNTYAVISVVVTETNNNGCSKSASAIVHIAN